MLYHHPMLQYHPSLHHYTILIPGLRGAVAFSLSTQLQFGAEQRSVLVTSTLVIVLFTILVFGGATLPLLKVWKVGALLTVNDFEKIICNW